jgi:hypothetical protein
MILKTTKIIKQEFQFLLNEEELNAIIKNHFKERYSECGCGINYECSNQGYFKNVEVTFIESSTDCETDINLEVE